MAYFDRITTPLTLNYKDISEFYNQQLPFKLIIFVLLKICYDY